MPTVSLPLRHVAAMCLASLALTSCAGGASDPARRSEGRSDPGTVDPTPAPVGDDQLRAFHEGDPPHVRWGFRIDDRVVVPARFDHASDFREGLARVRVQVDSAARGEEPPRFRWGFVDSTGTFRVAPRFTAASGFVKGRALVQDEGEFVFIDRSGSVVGPLAGAADAGPLPLPAEGVRSLEQYAAGLDLGVPFDTLLADPHLGETLLKLAVRPLRYGAIEVVELAWEGQGRELVLPHHSLDDARVIVQRLLGGREYRDITADGTFGDDVTYELVDPDALNEFFGIRRRPGGGVVIHHTHWYG